mgnify:CR=1 FL=1
MLTNARHFLPQEIRATGGPGYKYISVEEDEAGNVIFCNGTLLHLAAEQIPKGFAVSVKPQTA